MKTAEYWIRKLGLVKHPEGGFYGEIYRSPETIPQFGLPHRYQGSRSFLTAIYYLLPGHDVSQFHRLKSDEVWHFCHGSFITLWIIDPSGGLSEIKLGQDVESGQVFQAVIPAGHWVGAIVGEPHSYSLVGCTVAPGFDFRDFELGQKRQLLSLYPQHQAIIDRLAKD